MKYAVVVNQHYLYQRNIEHEGTWEYDNLPHVFEGTWEECAEWLDVFTKRNK